MPTLLDTGGRWVIYSIIIAAWVGVFAYSFIQYRRDSAAESAEAIRVLAEKKERDRRRNPVTREAVSPAASAPTSRSHGRAAQRG